MAHRAIPMIAFPRVRTIYIYNIYIYNYSCVHLREYAGMRLPGGSEMSVMGVARNRMRARAVLQQQEKERKLLT